MLDLKTWPCRVISVFLRGLRAILKKNVIIRGKVRASGSLIGLHIARCFALLRKERSLMVARMTEDFEFIFSLFSRILSIFFIRLLNLYTTYEKL